jgi:hypothetical protein
MMRVHMTFVTTVGLPLDSVTCNTPSIKSKPFLEASGLRGPPANLPFRPGQPVLSLGGSSALAKGCFQQNTRHVAGIWHPSCFVFPSSLS